MPKQAYSTTQPQLGTTRRSAYPVRTAPHWTSPLTLTKWLAEAAGWTPNMVAACRCQKDVAALVPLCTFLPRHRFGGSLFNTPLLLILRFFYQASSFDLTNPQADRAVIHPIKYRYRRDDLPLNRKAPLMPSTLGKKDNIFPEVFSHHEMLSTTDWSKKLSKSPSLYENCQVVSITWVKALASPLSHEFIQFIVEDTKMSTRSRVIADRHENGDWVIVGWNWASRKSPLDRHSLPLPLVSLVYDDPQTRPNVSSVAKMLADVTARRPSYNILKEMCWWYAEAVFEAVHAEFGGTLKEWKWARFRYSFIVRTHAFPRETLASEAEEFEKQNVEEMSY